MITLYAEDLKKNPHLLDPEKTHSFCLIWEGEWVSPNTDPDLGAPRTDGDDRAMATDVCFKRMMKDVLEDMFDSNLYLSREAAMNGQTGRDRAQKVENREEAVETYEDVRMFGAVFNKGGKEGGSGAADQILGPVQIGISIGTAFDGGPVTQHEMRITRIMDQKTSGATAMGRKTVLENVRFTTTGRYSGYLGKRHKVSGDDMERLWLALGNCVGHRPSSSRGFSRPVSLRVVTYDNEFGGRNNVAHTTTFDLAFDEWATPKA